MEITQQEIKNMLPNSLVSLVLAVLMVLVISNFTVAQISSSNAEKLIKEAKASVSTESNGATNVSNSTIDVVDELEVSDNPVNIPSISKKSSNPLFGFDFFTNENISFQPNANLSTPINYQLGPGDDLVISLWGAAENTYNVSVNRNGILKIPNVGPVIVNGLTIEAATKKINNSLLKVYQGISAPSNSPYKIFTDVAISNVRTVQVNIIGQVKIPGTYSLSSLSTVLNALYASGGPTEQGTFRDIKLIRNGEQISSFDIYKYLIEGSQKGNSTLKDQDVIIVGSFSSKIKINGKVKRPGTYEILPTEDFSDLLSFVSGFQSDAYKDVIKLERIEGDRKKLKEINYTSFKNEPLVDGDVISIGGIIDQIDNKVTINGEVYRPGNYELKTGMTLLDLIEKASGIKESAFLDRVLVTKREEDKVLKVDSYSLEDIIENKIEILLDVNDIVQVLNKYSFSNQGFLSISGAVNSPTQVPYVDDITLEELVLMAQGYKKGADTRVIDVTREIIDDDFNTITKSFKISAVNSLNIENNTSFKFEPNDKIIVRFLTGVLDKVTLAIEGEVLFPGSYEATVKNERIYDLINKSGGLTPFAFENGATLIRKNPYYKEIAQELTAAVYEDESTAESQLNDKLYNQREFRLGIDLKEIMASKGESKYNMILKDGDRLVIPSIKQTVKVDGQVMLPSLIRHDKALSFRDYISKSGGFEDDAKKSKSYILYPNGDIATTKRFLFFKFYPQVQPGSIVVVPQKKERSTTAAVSTQEVVGLTTGFATLALIIQRLFN